MWKALVISLFLSILSIAPVLAQARDTPLPAARSQEVDDAGIPVLAKHLPDWETVRNKYRFTNDVNVLKAWLGQPPALASVEFVPGTEAVTARYDAGELLIIEYPGPQASVETDGKVAQYLESTGDASTAYRRIGNYNVFVFGVTDPAAANALLDQVKYEKNIRWLGDDPFYQNRAERNFVVTTSDIFLSTVLIIILGMGGSVVAGLGAGLVYFMLRERRRSQMTEFSDAGGMIRLNLDNLTPDISQGRYLRD